MIKRPKEIKIRLTGKELETINKRAKESGYSRESYVRSLMNGRIPRPMPPPDYHAMIRELHAIGNNLNQISQKAHVLNVIDLGKYRANVELFIKALMKIENFMLLPEKFEL